jgi:NADH-quinone oxidoreductase subunit C
MKDLKSYIDLSLQSLDVTTSLEKEELTIYGTLAHLEEIARFLRENSTCWCRQLVDICGVDYKDRDPRFDVVYHFLSPTHNHRVRLIIGVEEDDLVPSLVHLFRSANWFEREVYDMFGLSFKNHTDLRRILTDYTFEGHPLRKDFPLTGFTEVHYCKTQERVMTRPVHLEEPLRDYKYDNPWQKKGQGGES